MKLHPVPRIFLFPPRGAEYAWVLENIALEKGRVLDIGSGESSLPLWLAYRGFDVYSIDVRDHSKYHGHHGVKFIRGNIDDSGLPNALFDVIIAISVIEHVGVGAYGDPIEKDGDLIAMEEIKRILKRNGRLILTTDYNRGDYIYTWQRFYDDDRLKLLTRGFEIEKREYIRRLNYFVARVSEYPEYPGDPSHPEYVQVCMRLRKI